MEYSPREGKRIPGIPDATLPPKRSTFTVEERTEVIQRLIQDEGENTHEAEEFVPQQQLPKQKAVSSE